MTEWSGFWQKMSNLRWGALDQHVLEQVGDTLGWGPDRTLLEIGCGRGMHTIRLYQGGRCGEFDLVDPAPEARRIAKAADGAPHRERTFYEDTSELSTTYDIVWSSGLVEHFFDEERQAIIDEHFRLANEWVVLVVPARTWTRRLFPPREEVPAAALYTAGELRDRMRATAGSGWNVTVTSFAPLFGVRHIPDAFYPVLDRLLRFLPDNLLLGVAKKERPDPDDSP